MLSPLTVLLAASALVLESAVALPTFYLPLKARSNPGVYGIVNIPAGFKTALFADDFSGIAAGGLPSTARWTIDTGTSYRGGPAQWGTGEVETYTKNKANLAITSSGTLLITPVKTTSGGKTTWTSARIESVKAYDFTCAVGKKLRITARLRLGGGAASTQLGIWAAFWSLGSKFRGNYNNWPAVGEIDVLESINGAAAAYQAVHCGTSSGGPCHESTGIASTYGFARNSWYSVSVDIDRTAAKSTADWKKESIVWALNGRTVFTLKATTVNNQAAWTALAQDAHFMLFNVAVGGAFPNAIAGKSTPTSATAGGSGDVMEIDRVAVYTT